MSIEHEYDRAFWQAGIARKALHVLDDALYSLKLQRKALEADARQKEHAFADFVIAHGDAIRVINEQRASERQAGSADEGES